MQDVIEMLLLKKEQVRAEAAAKEQRIDALLEMAGYTPPSESYTDAAVGGQAY